MKRRAIFISADVNTNAPFYLQYYYACGPIAQWLERPAHNRLVLGSNPSGPTNIIAALAGWWSGGVL